MKYRTEFIALTALDCARIWYWKHQQQDFGKQNVQYAKQQTPLRGNYDDLNALKSYKSYILTIF